MPIDTTKGGTEVNLVPLSLLAASGYGAANFFVGIASRRQHPAVTLLLSQLTALAMVLAWAILRSGHPGGLMLGVCAGTTAFFGAWAAYTSFSLGRPIGYAAALIGTASTVVPVAVGWISGKAPGPLAMAGLVVSIVAIFALRSPESDQRQTDKRVATLAITSGLAFGGYHVIMSRTTRAMGWWPLVASQATIVGLAIGLIAALAWRKKLKRPLFRAVPWSMADGTTSALATIVALPAVWGHKLPIVGTLLALAPVMTVLLGWLFLRERPRKLGIVGVMLALIAVVLLTVPVS